MRLVHRVFVLGVCALAAVSAPAPSASGVDALTVTRASASGEAVAVVRCPGGTRGADVDGATSPGGALTLSFQESFAASMDAAKAGCPGETTARASSAAAHDTRAQGGRVDSSVTLSSGIVATGDTDLDRQLGGLATANLDYELTAETAATYRIQATLRVARHANSSSRGSITLNAGNARHFVSAGQADPEQVTLSVQGRLDAGDEVSLSAFATASSEPGGLQESTASWEISLTVTPGAEPPPGPTGSLSGVVRFEKVPVTRKGLQTRKKRPEPAADVLVEVLDAEGSVVAETITDDLGRYAVDLPQGTGLRVRASARMGPFEVRRPGADLELYSIGSEPFDVPGEGAVTVDLLARDGVEAGPFNMLHVARKCTQLVRSAEPDIVFPPLRFRWDPDTDTQTAHSQSDGINPADIFVAGRRDVEAAELNDAVVAHEFAHYLVEHFGRNDSRGGSHRTSQSLDPRLAWSEGFANFFACAATGTSLFLRAGANGRPIPTVDIEQNRPRGAAVGYTGEYSVASFLWDVFDTRKDQGDGLALGFTPIWRAMRALRDDTYVYLGDFVDALYEADPSRGPALIKILRTHAVRCVKGSEPVFARPFPQPVASGATVKGVVTSVLKPPQVGSPGLSTSSRLLELTLTEPGTVRIDLIWDPVGGAPHDLDLFLLDGQGTSLLSSESHDPASITESIESETLPAGTYVVEVASAREVTNRVFEFNAGRFRVTVDY